MIRWFLVVAAAFVPPVVSDAENIDVWVGTSNHKASQGIYHTRLDTQSGKLAGNVTLAAEIRGPGFLTKHPQHDVLYAVGKLDGVDCVAAYQVVGPTGKRTLKPMNHAPIGNGGSCHVSVHPGGKLLLTAQYGTGSVGVFRLNLDGSIDQQTKMIKHQGGSRVVANRQTSPHAHWTGYSPDGRFAFVPDLGLDQVVIYRVDADAATITPHGHFDAVAGGGPRHMKFHPSGKFAYVLNELALSVTVCDYDAEAGILTAKQTLPTVAEDQLAKEQFTSASEVRVHPSGRFVYTANRGHDTISAFAVDSADGTLSVVEVENARATTPRNFCLSPDGRWLVTAGQDSFTLASFVVDSESGELTYDRSTVQVPAPICVLFE